MKLVRVNLFKRLRKVHLFSRRHVRRRPYLAPTLGVLLGVAVVGGVFISRPSLTLRPSDSHVVFLTDNGTRQTLDTKAKTVGELVNRLPLHLIPQDVVEPALNTKIVQDNFRINVYRARPVTVEEGGSKTVTLTAQKSPRVVAQNAGLKIYPEDYVNFAPGSVAENIIGEKVVIDPATPVNFNLYGTNLTVRTHSKTVADLLAEKNITPAKGDTVQPKPDALVTANMQVFVIRNGKSIKTVQKSIPAPVETVSDHNLTLGAEAIRQAGSPGIEVVTYEVTTKNGKEVKSKAIQTVVVSKPVPEIIARGTIVDIAGNKTAVMAAAGVSAGDYGYADFIVSHESNWTPNARNASGAYGLCQALPGSKMASAGGDWASNPVTQLRWCSSYANGTYGSWYGAYSFWINHAYW